MIFLWFPIIILWFSYDFPMVSYDFPMVFMVSIHPISFGVKALNVRRTRRASLSFNLAVVMVPAKSPAWAGRNDQRPGESWGGRS